MKIKNELTLLIIIIGFSQLLSCKSTGNSYTPKKYDQFINHTLREEPIAKKTEFIYSLEVFELKTDSTRSENPIKISVIYHKSDTFELKHFLNYQVNWQDADLCEDRDDSWILGNYFCHSKIDSTGHFIELNVIRAGNSVSCTDSFKNKLIKALEPLIIIDEHYFNKNIYLRLEVQLE